MVDDDFVAVVCHIRLQIQRNVPVRRRCRAVRLHERDSEHLEVVRYARHFICRRRKNTAPRRDAACKQRRALRKHAVCVLELCKRAAARNRGYRHVVFRIGIVAEISLIRCALRTVHDMVLPYVFQSNGIICDGYFRLPAALHIIRRNAHIKVFIAKRCRCGRNGKYRAARRLVTVPRRRLDDGNVLRGAFADINVIARARAVCKI